MNAKRSDVVALYVDARGPYPVLLEPECCFDVFRDARTYDGALPAVAHPPCARWGWHARQFSRDRAGADGGCFRAALDAVTRVGGVIEHPASSVAWTHFGLQRPGGFGWTRGRDLGDRAVWCCAVDQGWFGHPAPKRTWLYLVTRTWVTCPPPELPWSKSPAKGRVCDLGSKWEREKTPMPFARLLIALAVGDPGAVRDLVDAAVTRPGGDPLERDLLGVVTSSSVTSAARRQRESRQRRVVTRARFVIGGEQQ